MKKFALTTTAVLLGFSMWAAADDSTSAQSTPDAAACCTTDGSCKNAKSPCCKTDKGIQCGDQAWLDMETVTVEADNGNPIAQYTVAYLVETADSATPEDAAKSQEWYKKALPGLEKAAAEGHPAACKALAHMYAEGKGVEKNPEMAAKYEKMYKECCEKKCKEMKDKKWHGKKQCCPMGPGPVQPAPKPAE